MGSERDCRESYLQSQGQQRPELEVGCGQGPGSIPTPKEKEKLRSEVRPPALFLPPPPLLLSFPLTFASLLLSPQVEVEESLPHADKKNTPPSFLRFAATH